jgi:hypothetical protein
VRRTAQNWVTVHLVGQSEPIRCTPEHPIWSKSRQRWVGAGHLEAGEELDAAGDGDEPPSGRTARAVVVERIERHASPAAVFNLEVHRAHTYRVGAGGVLVHNTCDLTPAQDANLGRFKDSLPNGAGPVSFHELPNGGVAFQSTVPGQVPGSYAIYEKQVDAEGVTVQFTKTTVDPHGRIVHTKDKLTGATVTPGQ